MSGLEILAWSPFDPWHMVVLGVVALLLFGKRLPEVGRSLGKGIAEFKKGLHDVQDELSRDDSEDEPPKRKLEAPRGEDEQSKARRFAAGEDEEPAYPEERRDSEE